MVLKDEISKWELLRSKSFESDEWTRFQTEVFPYERINLNSSTFGSPSIYLKKAREYFLEMDLQAYPLGLYEKGRQEIGYARFLAQQLWGSDQHYLSITKSSSELQNTLMLNLLLFFYRKNRHPPIKALTSKNEHVGGAGFFVNKKEICVEYLSEDEVENSIYFEKRLEILKPDIFFISHLTYDTAFEFPIHEWSATIKRIIPECIIVLDCAQSLGLLPIILPKEIDFCFASSHKWLMGPYGLGFFWISHSIFSEFNKIEWNGETLDSDWVASGFEMKGGQAFDSYASLGASLLLYSVIGIDSVLRRSHFLLQFLMSTLSEILMRHRVIFQYSSRTGFLSSHENLSDEINSGFFSVHFQEVDPYPLYSYLNDNCVHIKCIKKGDINLLRIGTPYYESIERLTKLCELIDTFFKNNTQKLSPRKFRA